MLAVVTGAGDAGRDEPQALEAGGPADDELPAAAHRHRDLLHAARAPARLPLPEPAHQERQRGRLLLQLPVHGQVGPLRRLQQRLQVRFSGVAT